MTQERGVATFADWLLAWAEPAQYAAFFSLLVLLLGLERRSSRHFPPQERRGRYRTNFMLTALNVLVLGALPLSFLGAALWAERHAWGAIRLVAMPGWLAWLATLLLRGFIAWLTHLLLHHVPLLWRVHRVHHTDTALDVSTTVRFHPLEFVIGLVIGAPLVVMFGLEPAALVAYELLDVAVTLFSHSALFLPARVERVLRWLIVTPELHRLHHSTDPAEADRNFSAVFPIWDRVFGTFATRPREYLKTLALGLSEVRDERSCSVSWLLTSPLRGELAAAPAARRWASSLRLGRH